MKKLWIALLIAAPIVSGILGFSVCQMTNERNEKRQADAREIRVQEFSRTLADSIAATEAWLAQAQAKDSLDVVKSIEHIKVTYADSKHTTAFADGISSFEKMLSDIQSEQLPYMAQTRRHINWMKQEIAWLNREKELLP